ncbi:hypothetical protein JCM14469_42950 [Desulfatiferula olefinivorans]
MKNNIKNITLLKIALSFVCFSVFFSSYGFSATAALHLVWIAPNSGGPVSGYYLYYDTKNYSTESEILANMEKIDTESNNTFYNINGLECGIDYYVYVQAYNGSGIGPISDVKIKQLIPSKVKGINVSE